MVNPLLDKLEKSEGKELYDYQSNAIENIFDRLNNHPLGYNLL
ncbi:MAG: hypothetical protein ACJAX8_001319, partial [Flavobacteriales bacterium]